MALNKDEIDAIAKVSSEVVKPAYDDAIKPAAQQVGKALDTVAGVINVALSPIAVLVHGFEKVEEKLKEGLEKKLSSVDPENILQPPLNIVGPLLDKYKYNHESEVLSDMFMSLLANSMDKNTVENAHPSFVDIIAQLSPDEARLFKMIATNPMCPKLDLLLKNKNKDQGYNIIYRNFIELNEGIGLNHPHLVPTFLDNLQRLNLINCTSGQFQEAYTNKDVYKSLKESNFIQTTQKQVDKEIQDLELKEGYIWVTDYGRTFFKAIVRE